MSGAVETESPRPRPLSGGLWNLFSWLRRDEHSSTDSISSAGSDRTAASFAFLPPGHYDTASPALLPTLPPPTDSYKKRVRDWNVRRQHDLDITLHRKYGLYGYNYEAFSLPNTRRVISGSGERVDRSRRAASESLRAHVPGKRRAPQPPSTSTGQTTRRRARKRPAPLPPLDLIKENVEDDVTTSAIIEPMNRPPLRDDLVSRNNDNVTGCKPEKYSKKDAQPKETKEVKMRHEKSFLKQIFENRKRNSAIDTASVKLLPNISELDKQAAEMIEKYRLKELTRDDVTVKEPGNKESPGSSKYQSEAWICTRCLKKYDSSVITCNYCLPLNRNSNSNRNSMASDNYSQTNLNSTPQRKDKIEDKEKLKEMLKEMKNNLPKRPKAETSKNTADIQRDYTVEAPTLRIGSQDKNPRTSSNSSKIEPTTSPSVNKDDKNIQQELTTINSVLITQPVVLVHTELNVVQNDNKTVTDLLPVKKRLNETTNIKATEIERISSNEPNPVNIITKNKYDLNTPLKISALLNPIYVPKSTSTTNTQTPTHIKQVERKENTSQSSITPEHVTRSAINTTFLAITSPSQIKSTTSNSQKTADAPKPQKEIEIKEMPSIALVSTSDKKSLDIVVPKNTNVSTGTSISAEKPSTSYGIRVPIDQHAKRRDLINQLEKSIAKGDEQAAAEAAVKLAQLKLSCSVLSFSSQIVAEPSTSSNVPQQQSNILIKNNRAKMEDTTEMLSQVKTDHPVKAKESENVYIKERNNDNSSPNNVKVLNKLEINSEKKISNGIQQKPAPSEPSTSSGTSKNEIKDEDVPILVWVEDKEATRGPVQLHVRRNAVMGDLRGQAEKSLGLAARMQRWIVGRNLCSDDNTPLVALAGPELSVPFYLCLVESDTKESTTKFKVEVKAKADPGNVYNELVNLEKQPLVSNAEVFECGVCMEECTQGDGVVLRECVHSFCKNCLSDVVRHSEEPVVSCPGMGCRGVLQEREVRGLVSPNDYEKWLARGLAAAESGTRNAFHCRTRDCPGWALCDPGVRRFPCPVCKHTNCVLCQAIHEGQTCEQHKASLQESVNSSDANQTDDGTRALLNTLIKRGEALECPECSAIITKKWGCDWVKCSACKTEICWVTKGRRWGPGGRGDTSAGCRCGIDGKRCHPSCGYCH